MIVATDIELRAGARLLLDGASFQVSAGDRIGLVGPNGAGKTTLAKVLAGEAQPAAGSVRRSGTVGYLPQDPRTGNLDMLAIDRVLSARGLDQLRAELRAAEVAMAGSDSAAAADAIRKYSRLEERLAVLGGYAAESQAASITASLGIVSAVGGEWRTWQGGAIDRFVRLDDARAFSADDDDAALRMRSEAIGVGIGRRFIVPHIGHAQPAADLQDDVGVGGIESRRALDDAEDVRIDEEVLAEVAPRVAPASSSGFSMPATRFCMASRERRMTAGRTRLAHRSHFSTTPMSSRKKRASYGQAITQ